MKMKMKLSLMAVLLLLVAVYSNAQPSSSDDDLDRWGEYSIAVDGEKDSGEHNSLFCRSPKLSSELSDEEESIGDDQSEKIYSRKDEEAKQIGKKAKSCKRRSRAMGHLSRPAQPQDTVALSFLAYGGEGHS